MHRLFVLLLFTILYPLSNARAALPPLSEEELAKQAEVIITGRVSEAHTTIKRRSSTSIYAVELSVTVESVEKGQEQVSADDMLTIHCWTIRTSKMAGPSGHGPIPGEGSGFRMWLRQDVDGLWEPLEPNGIELLTPKKPISFGVVEKRRIRNALIVSVPVLAGIIAVLFVRFGRQKS